MTAAVKETTTIPVAVVNPVAKTEKSEASTAKLEGRPVAEITKEAVSTDKKIETKKRIHDTTKKVCSFVNEKITTSDIEALNTLFPQLEEIDVTGTHCDGKLVTSRKVVRDLLIQHPGVYVKGLVANRTIEVRELLPETKRKAFDQVVELVKSHFKKAFPGVEFDSKKVQSPEFFAEHSIQFIKLAATLNEELVAQSKTFQEDPEIKEKVVQYLNSVHFKEDMIDLIDRADNEQFFNSTVTADALQETIPLLYKYQDIVYPYLKALAKDPSASTECKKDIEETLAKLELYKPYLCEGGEGLWERMKLWGQANAIAAILTLYTKEMIQESGRRYKVVLKLLLDHELTIKQVSASAASSSAASSSSSR